MKKNYNNKFKLSFGKIKIIILITKYKNKINENEN